MTENVVLFLVTSLIPRPSSLDFDAQLLLESITTCTCERLRHLVREPIGWFSISGRTFSQMNTGPGSPRMRSTLMEKVSRLS